ncbi:hypothetical protein BJY00DRAFT_320236 [Aspergillus carlsbadensis]|nr:hypothetical protein BJY00DRAFT_320236 [Aspergillus carlsbadensis]
MPRTTLAILILTLLTALTTPLTPPQTIKINILYPTGSVSNNHPSGYFPVIFALQNAEAAYTYEYELSYRLYNASTWATHTTTNSSSNAAINQINAGGWPDIPYLDDFIDRHVWSNREYADTDSFAYYFDDVAIAASDFYQSRYEPLVAGEYVMHWVYSTENCAEGEIWTVAWGAHAFSIAAEGEGDDLSTVLADKCPEYGGAWSVLDTRDDGCPFRLEQGISEDERDPCSAKLQSPEQVECLVEYYRVHSSNYTTRNDTRACREGFSVAEWDGGVDSYDDLGFYDEDGHATEPPRRGGGGDGDQGLSVRAGMGTLVSVVLVVVCASIYL